MSDWQPIENAPRHQEVWVYWPAGECNGVPVEAGKQKARWMRGSDWVITDCGKYTPSHPTHWAVADSMCAECGAGLDPVEKEAGRDICETCEWDLRHFAVGEDA